MLRVYTCCNNAFFMHCYHRGKGAVNPATINIDVTEDNLCSQFKGQFIKQMFSVSTDALMVGRV